MTARPRDASTVMILRPPQEGDSFEVLLLLRHPSHKFVPSHYVFPGGAVEEEDADPRLLARCRGENGEPFAGEIPGARSPEGSLAFWAAAVRETFEEAGVLFAADDRGNFPDPAQRAHLFIDLRGRLLRSEISFRELLEQEELFIPCHRLRFISRWITPAFLPIRYDARFFAALLPAGQEASPDGGEHTDGRWLSPSGALAENRRGRLDLVLPTLMTLEEAGRYAGAEEAWKGFAASGYREG